MVSSLPPPTLRWHYVLLKRARGHKDADGEQNICPSRRLLCSTLYSTNAYESHVSIEEKHLAHYTLDVASLMDVREDYSPLLPWVYCFFSPIS